MFLSGWYPLVPFIVSAFRGCSTLGYFHHLNDCIFPFSQFLKGYCIDTMEFLVKKQ